MNSFSTPRRPKNLTVRFTKQYLMKVISCCLLAVLLLLYLGANAVENGQAAILANVSLQCQPFTQVNDDAFGLDTGSNSSYSSEEAFEVLVFNGQLYLGMEGDNIYGARIWRTKPGVQIATSQSNWEEVAADPQGYPFGIQNVVEADHIDSLAEFNGNMFASVANGGTSSYGTRVFRSPSGDPGTWVNTTAEIGPGFGSTNNINFKDMQVFDGHLCGGTQNWSVGAQVWCTSDGSTWMQKNFSGFGESAANPRNTQVWSGYVYNGAMYFGTHHVGALYSNYDDDIGKLYRTSSLAGTPSWEEVFSGESGSYRVNILGELDGYLYVSARSTKGIVIYRSLGGNQGTWQQVNVPGMDGDANNYAVSVDTATTYNDALYVAITNKITGLELWRTTGLLDGNGTLVAWDQVGGSGLGNPNNILAQLIPYNGYLYAWTANYSTGQQVLQTECGYEETITVGSPDVEYTFAPEIGAQIRFQELGTVSQVSVRAYPGAWDPEGLIIDGVVPVKRHYNVSVNGAGYQADVTLKYDQSEFEQSEIGDETTTYQAIWSGVEWEACPMGHQDRDTVANTVSCVDVKDLTKVTISGGTSPTAVRLTAFQAAPQSNNPIWGLLLISLLSAGSTLYLLTRRSFVSR